MEPDKLFRVPFYYNFEQIIHHIAKELQVKLTDLTEEMLDKTQIEFYNPAEEN